MTEDLPAIDWPLVQTCCYWPYAGSNLDGSPIFGTVIEILCRWDEEVVEFLTPSGDRKMSKAVVLVDRKITRGCLALIPIIDLVNPTDPYFNGGWLVRGYEVNPDIEGSEALYTVYL